MIFRKTTYSSTAIFITQKRNRFQSETFSRFDRFLKILGHTSGGKAVLQLSWLLGSTCPRLTGQNFRISVILVSGASS